MKKTVSILVLAGLIGLASLTTAQASSCPSSNGFRINVYRTFDYHPQAYRTDYFQEGRQSGYRLGNRHERRGLSYHHGYQRGLERAHRYAKANHLSNWEYRQYIRGFRAGYFKAHRW
ncbi:MAG: hypothetical protein AAGF10_02650 [Verrucomicrobiota bacterium]